MSLEKGQKPFEADTSEASVLILDPEKALAVRIARERGETSTRVPVAHDSINAALCAIQEGREPRSLAEVYTGQMRPEILAELVSLATTDQAQAA